MGSRVRNAFAAPHKRWLAAFALLIAVLVLLPADTRGGQCLAHAADTTPADYCNSFDLIITYDGVGTVTDQAVRFPWDPATLISGQNMTPEAWDLLSYQSSLTNQVNLEAQDLTANSAGGWVQVPSATSGDTFTIRNLIGSPEQKRDQGVLMTGGETITTSDNDALDLTDMWTSRVSLILLDDTARNETIAEHHDGVNGRRIDLLDNAGSLEVQCTVDATTVSIAFDALWVDTVRDFACELDSLGDGLTITEEVSGTTASIAAGPIGAAVAVDMVVGASSLTSAIVLDYRLLDNRVRMSSLGVPTVIIDRFTLDAASASETLTVDVSGLPFTPRHLVLSCQSAATAGGPNLQFRLNGDSGANYNYQVLSGVGATASASRQTGVTAIEVATMVTTANVWTSAEVLLADALSTRSHKSTLSLAGWGEGGVRTVTGRWANAAAIASVTVGSSSSAMIAGSTCNLAVVDERYATDEQILSVAGTFDFTDVPNRNGYVGAIANWRSDRAATADATDVEFNGDTTATNYFRQYVRGAAAATSAATANSNVLTGGPIGDTGTAGAYSPFLFTMQNGYIAENDPHFTVLHGYHSTVGPDSQVAALSGRRDNVEGVREITFSPSVGTNFVANSMATLYFVPTTIQSVVELDSAAASITFSAVEPAPAARVSLYGRGDNASATVGVTGTFNADATAANYDLQTLSGDGAVVTAATSAADATLFSIPGSTATANVFGGGTAWILNYAASDRHKARLALMGAADDNVFITSSRWENTDPVTSMTLTPSAGNFDVGVTAMLETVNGFGTVVRYGYDGQSMAETSAADPVYSGTFDDYTATALTATYVFNRPQTGVWTVSVGPLTPTGIPTGPVVPTVLPDVVGPGFGTAPNTAVAENCTGIFGLLFCPAAQSIGNTWGNHAAWSAIIGGASVTFMVMGFLVFRFIPVAILCAGFPMGYGVTQGFIPWWWMSFWAIAIAVTWFGTRQGESVS